MAEEERGEKRRAVSRRRFLLLGGAAAAASGMLAGVRIRRRGRLSGAVAEASELPPASRGYRKAVVQTVTLTVNGTAQTIEVDTRTSLAMALRDQLHLTGTHVTCDRGECGACTVLVDGRAVYSCSVLAVQMQGKQITTVEGLGKGEKLDPVQEAMIEHDGFQCGYCTSGQIMSLKGLLLKNPNPTEEDVRQAVAGNICRCGAYPGIIKAGLTAAEKMKGQGA